MGITEWIADKCANYDNPNSIGSRFRARRLRHLLSQIERVHRAAGRVRILDVGGRKSYWNIIAHKFLEEHSVHITILNLPCENQPEDDAMFAFVKGDACNLNCYADNAFDIVHSNSVIEHVGNWSNMKKFAQEASRLAPNIFVQTPYFWFPLEPHYMTPFFHWMPWPLQLALVSRYNLGNRGKGKDLDASITNLEDAPKLLDQRRMRLLFPTCQLVKEKFLFLTKSMIAVRTTCIENH